MSETTEIEAAAILRDGAASIAATTSTDDLGRVETDLFGKRSVLANAQRSLGGLDPEARREKGRQFQEARSELEALVATRRAELAQAERAATLVADRLDLTEVIVDQVRSPLSRGHLHLVTQARDELEDVFVGMGFSVAEGPEAESDWYNFEALNFPPGHPARGMYDTMYLDIGEPETVLLRTHTSPVQIHLMEEAVRGDTLPIHAVMPGKCFRLDTPDATHLPVFNQIEGLVVDKGITFGDLAGTIQTFTTAYFGQGMQSRLRPAYFPFTEPSAEFEITCAICRGTGCRTCSNTGWIELGGCGMVDPAVFAAVGIDANVWSGFAFGFGIDRCALMRHEIPDLRSFIENDIRFLSQF
ncbi:MAG TPA: phenylalanine--tRNA ligase subunit alpha [Acidimicrobiales bacterium]|jgi:phenylalanyl-tRNA synthetase alpha chain|nr:phenylalanine--tRNA ligase subunit alpha [Acidimicrobiales bacterium]